MGAQDGEPELLLAAFEEPSLLAGPGLEAAGLRLLHRLHGVIRDPSASVGQRKRAARLAFLLAVEIEPSDRIHRAAMSALEDCLDRRDSVGWLIRTFFGTAPDREALFAETRRLAAKAHAEGNHDALIALLIIAVGMGGLEEGLCPDWLVDSAPGREDRVAFLIKSFVENHGHDHAWLRETVERRPELLSSEELPLETAQLLRALVSDAG